MSRILFSSVRHLPTALARLPWWLPLILGVIPAWLAWRFAFPYPRADHWGVVIEPYLLWKGGTPFWEVIHLPHNDSRMDAPLLAHFGLIQFARWSLRLEALLSVGLGILAAGLLLRQLKALPGWEVPRPWTALIPWLAAFWILSPKQWMNWTWGIQICYGLVVLFTLATVFTLRSRLPRAARLAAGAAFATAASLSFVNGWIAWILGVGWLAWECHRDGWRIRVGWISLGCWLAAAALVWLWIPPTSPHGQSAEGVGLASKLLENPAGVIRYFLHVLGAPFSDLLPTWDRGDFRLKVNETAATLIGAASLLFGGLLFLRGLLGEWKEQGRAVSLWWILAALGLGNALAIALARTGMAASNPFESRYPAYVIWYHIAVIGLWSHSRSGWLCRMRWVWLGVLLWGTIIGAVMGLRDVRVDHDRNRPMGVAAAMRHVAPEPDFLSTLSYRSAEETIRILDILEEDGLLSVPTIKSSRPSEAKSWNGAKGRLESVETGPNGPSIRGWAIEASSRDCVDGVAISVEAGGQPERWLGVAQKRGRRESLARKLNATALFDRVGWEFAASSDDLEAWSQPSGPVVFRAYAVNLREGSVQLLEGEGTLGRAEVTSPSSTDP